jgi:hypothetical protein
MDTNGDFAIVWTSHNQDGNGWGVYGQRYNASGAAVGGEFRVNTTTANDQMYANVAMNDSGAFVVTWSSHGYAGSGAWTICAQRYDASGNSLGGEIQVSPASNLDRMNSSAAIDSAGDVIINWSGATGLSGAQNSKWMIYAQQYSPSGAALGLPFMVNTTTGFDQKTPSIAMNNEGNVVSVWAGGSATDTNGVLMQQYLLSFVGLEGAAGDTFMAQGNRVLPASELPHHRVVHREGPVATHAEGKVLPNTTHFHWTGAELRFARERIRTAPAQPSKIMFGLPVELRVKA